MFNISDRGRVIASSNGLSPVKPNAITITLVKFETYTKGFVQENTKCKCRLGNGVYFVSVLKQFSQSETRIHWTNLLQRHHVGRQNLYIYRHI